jgi:hypothetical protein
VRIDLHDLSYLASGTPRQRDALRVIRELRLWENLAAYTPALAGTVPLDVDIEGSDLDIICDADDPGAFERDVRQLYSREADFRLQHYPGSHVSYPTVVANFRRSGWSIELYAQPVPVAEQDACLHLLVEGQLLDLAGKLARDAIRELKRQGWATEPAFAAYFGLAGDPYEELARLAGASDEELRRVASQAR